MTKERFKLIVDIHLFLVKDNKILLMLRKNTGYMDDYYHVPAGHLEDGEKIINALVRESKEEVGVSIDPRDAKFVHAMHNKSDNERLAFFFEVQKWSGDIKNMEPGKCGGLDWFPLDNLPEKIVPYAKASIEYYLKGVSFSHYGWE